MPPCLRGNRSFPGAGSTTSPVSGHLCAFTGPLLSAFPAVKWDTTASPWDRSPSKATGCPLARPPPSLDHAVPMLTPTCFLDPTSHVTSTRVHSCPHPRPGLPSRAPTASSPFFPGWAVTGDHIVVSVIMVFFFSKFINISFYCIWILSQVRKAVLYSWAMKESTLISTCMVSFSRSYIQISDPFGLDSCVFWEIRVQFDLFPDGNLAAPT